MAEKNDFDKTLTKEELATENYLEWSNETIGRCVKHFANELANKDIDGFKGIKTMASVYTLINVALSVNAGELKQEVGGFTYKGEPKGDWEIIVRQKVEKKKRVKN